MLTPPQRRYPSPTRKTKLKSLWELAHDRVRAIRGAAVLGTATSNLSKVAAQQPGSADCKSRSATVTGAREAAAEQEDGCSRGDAETLQQAGSVQYQPTAAGPLATNSPSKAAGQQPGSAACKGNSAAVTGAPQAAAEQEEGCSSGDAETLQQAGPGPDLARGSAAGPKLEYIARGSKNVVISLPSSMPTPSANGTSMDDGTDDDISVGTYSNRGSPAAGASMQPPAASLAPAIKAAAAARSGDSGDIVIALGDADQPNSAAQSGTSVLEEQGSLEAQHLQALLNAPGVRPTPICLFRQGDVDWLFIVQLRKLLMSNVHKSEFRRYSMRWPAERRLMTPKEREILIKTGVLGKSVSKAMLVTVTAACKVLQRLGAPAATIAAIQGLQGARPMTPAEISSLAPLSGLQSAREGGDSMDDSDNDAPAAAQHAGQAARLPAQASCSMLQMKGGPVANRAEVKGKQGPSAVPHSSGDLPEGEGQSEHLRVLLDAPGIRPTALCLFRQGDVDWLCLYEMHKVLPIYIPRGFINKGIPTGSTRAATCKEKAFLVATRVYLAPDGRHPAALVTVEAACSLLQDFGAPALTVAAVQRLQGAKSMTPADISSISPLNGTRGEKDDKDSGSNSYSGAPAAAQQPMQQTWSHVQTSRNVLDLTGILAARAVAARGGREALAMPQAEHLQVLLNAPGIRPTSMCLFREGDKDWLCLIQIRNVLMTNVSQQELRGWTSRWPSDKRQMTPTERAFLADQGVLRNPVNRGLLITVTAAYDLVRQFGAPVTAVAAVQGLQGAKPMTPAEISSLSHLGALQSAERDDNTDIGIDGDAMMLDQPGEKSRAPSAVQQSGQTAPTCQHRAAAAMEASSSLEPPETPVRSQPARATLGAKRSSSDAFGVSAERLAGSRSLKAGRSSGEMAISAGSPRADAVRTDPPGQAHTTAQIAQPETPPQALEGAMPVLDVEDEHVSRAQQIAARAAKQRPAPFGTTPDGVPPAPTVVESAELVNEQENLVEIIFSRKVFEEYQRRWDGPALAPGHGDKAKSLVVQQIARWLAFSPEEKKRYMEERSAPVELTDISHPAYRRFKEVLEPLGLRRKEQALQFSKSLPEWTLLGEYCGVWETQDSSSADDDNNPDIEDPFGLGPLLYDKVSDLGYSSKSAPEAASEALRVKWAEALQLDPSRAHNRLCLINDYRGVPDAPDGNVAWVEIEDSRTLRPHLFIFTAVSVKAGQEVLLDYGETDTMTVLMQEFHKDMEGPVARAAFLVETQPEAVAVHRALKAKEREARDRAKEVQDLQRALQQEGLAQLRLKKEAAEGLALLKAQADDERALAAGMQQQLAQASEAAIRQKEIVKEEQARFTAQAEEDRAEIAGMQQQLAQAQEATCRLERAAVEQRAAVSAQAEEKRANTALVQQQGSHAQEAARILGAAIVEELAQLKAQVKREEARAVRAEQRTVQAQETAVRLAEEADRERARLKAEAERQRARAASMQQQLKQAQEAAARLIEKKLNEKYAQLKAEAEQQMEQQMLQAQEALAGRAKSTEKEHLQLRAQVEDLCLRATCVQQLAVQTFEAAQCRAKAFEEDRAQLTARAEEEQARTASMEQQMLQAQESLTRLAKEADEKRLQLEAKAEGERLRANSVQHKSAQAAEAAQRLEKEAESERNRLEAQVEEQQAKATQMEQQVLQAQEAAKAAAAAQMQQLEMMLQERDAALQQARAEAKSSRQALCDLQRTHQDVCKRSDIEIKRLSSVAKQFERRLAELTKHLPPDMTIEHLLALGRMTPLQIVPVGRQPAPDTISPPVCDKNVAQQSAAGLNSAGCVITSGHSMIRPCHDVAKGG